MEILPYQDWMRPQVIAMFANEYGVITDEFEKLFNDFYESPYQKNRCIRIVAVEGEMVGGFQSFFFWPLVRDGKTHYTLQSGNSLVHPQFRGKGLFAKMLDYIHQPENNYKIEGLIGFPVEMSYNSFIRNKWKNPFNLQWFIKPMNPILSLFSDASTQLDQHFGTRNPKSLLSDKSIIRIEQSDDFDNYRFSFQQGKYWRYIYEEGGEECLFEFKLQKRKKWITELVIGKCIPTSYDVHFLNNAFRFFQKEVRKATSVSFMSFACNPELQEYQKVLMNNRFRRISKSIYFIVKGPMFQDNNDWRHWDIQRGDIDTW